MSTATIESPARSGADDLESHLIVQIDELRDENSRSRLREALWISIIFHFIVLFSIRQIPHWWPTHEVKLQSQAELLKQRELTYIEQPPDTQRVEKRPETDKISDKNRIATSKAPQIDRRALEKLSRSGLPGAPGVNPTQPPAPPQVAQQQTPSNAPPAPQQSQTAGQQQSPAQPTQTAKLEQPPVTRGGGVFQTSPSLSAGTAIEQAARASASARAAGVSGDHGGGFGRPNTSVRSDLEILTDTMGVDFSPYMQRVLQAVRMNWYNIIPEVARPPLMKQGNVFIEFVITKDGAVKGMRLAGPSGDVSLDRAAWGGITASNPFPPLPGEFKGEFIALRFRFMYNPDRNELR